MSDPKFNLRSERPASVWRRLLLAICLLQFALLLCLIMANRQLSNSLKASSVIGVTTTTNRQEPVFYGKSGPWGDLKYVRITIEPPDEFVPVDDRVFEKTRWHFAGYQRSQLADLFNACDLTPAQRAGLLDTNTWSDAINDIVVTPSDRLILELSEAARTKIYSVLAESVLNDFQYWPFTFRLDGFDEWFQRSGVSDATRALVRRLTYRRGQSLCFSDLPEVFAQIPTVAERRRLFKTLSRNSTLLMKLQINPDTDTDDLYSYWAKGGRAKDLKPLLESLTKVPGGITIDVAHLLPPFARKRLNSYPFPQADPSVAAPDCFWTALNFFNEPPDDRYRDDNVWKAELQANYTVVTQPTYGDLIFLLRPDDSPLHAAVYVADDVVFTKNGGNYRQPWILMEWADLMARYPENHALRTVIFHRTGPAK
jgi:hypothetical protein